MRVAFEGREHDLAAGESVLECLERHGEQVASMCRAGVCQCCLLRAESGEIPGIAQQGLKESWRAQGLFMPCVCRPTGDLQVVRTDAIPVFHARILDVLALSPRVMRVRLSTPDFFRFSGGQFIQLVRPQDGLMRSYSIASLPGEEQLEMHVAMQPEGKMSQWLAASPGAAVEVRGPLGECSYVEGEPERPLLLAGTGTGLSPLYAVLRSALLAGHTGPIHLFHAAAEPRELYLWQQLGALAAGRSNVRIAASVPGGESTEPGISALPLPDQLLATDLPMKAARAYLCGNPDFVRSTRKRLYLQGMPLGRIHADPFVPPAANGTMG